VIGLVFKVQKKFLAQGKAHGLFGETHKAAVKRLPELDPESFFDFFTRRTVNFLHIPIVIAGILRAVGPVEKRLWLIIKKQIRIQNEILVAGSENIRIEKF
jgi:hypothetical protein